MALLSVARDIATELAPHGVRCAGVSPGWVDTPLMEQHMDADMMEALRTRFDRVPIRRLVTAGEVAAMCAFVASDEASAVTGCELSATAAS